MTDGGSRSPATAGGGASFSVGVRERRRPFLNPALSSHYGVARAALSGPKAPPSRVRQVVLLVLAAGLSGFTILQGIAPHDEGLMLQAGARIASGQWPYRDFWLNYPPGQPVVLAALQEVFGNSLLAWRVLATIVQAVVALEAYRLARRRAPESYALLAWLAVAAVMAWPSLPTPNAPALALAFGALLAARSRPSLGGALAGLAFVFRFEIGVAALVGALLTSPPGTRLRTAATGILFAVVPLVPFFLAAPHADVSRHDRLLRHPGPAAPPLPDRLQRPVAPEQADRVLHPADPGGVAGPVGAGDGDGDRHAWAVGACHRGPVGRHRGARAGAGAGGSGVVAGTVGPGRTRLPARPHR